ncbi:hypothetical protein A2480_02380 [Candidatus Uhrbacteria bacterium RIFOXYC2_FULL_47_19]|uniref:Uncharacterized protein n=1 Tax=Candidatus Uhrbacteria bacterium RIFOXYC2_FULL_47_19 TaxID=1802424 RepID=A0A1F7WG65_9BACT|nr:MAG: hypothetical protein A2480_02380 [Candidatus Uhrbacteria bacterium RIFOXYC2_FULL_47_19]HCC22317.1 hypothetical protein [Candidatus Uhrbacteria bacterium]
MPLPTQWNQPNTGIYPLYVRRRYGNKNYDKIKDELDAVIELGRRPLDIDLLIGLTEYEIQHKCESFSIHLGKELKTAIQKNAAVALFEPAFLKEGETNFDSKIESALEKVDRLMSALEFKRQQIDNFKSELRQRYDQRN